MWNKGFRRVFTLGLFMLLSSRLLSQTTIWQENFDAYYNGRSSVVGKWIGESGDGYKYAKIESSCMYLYASRYSIVEWETTEIDISKYQDVELKLDAGAYYYDRGDFRIQYQLDGGVWQVFKSIPKSDWTIKNILLSNINANTISIRAVLKAYGSGDVYGNLDNITITGRKKITYPSPLWLKGDKGLSPDVNMLAKSWKDQSGYNHDAIDYPKYNWWGNLVGDYPLYVHDNSLNFNKGVEFGKYSTSSSEYNRFMMVKEYTNLELQNMSIFTVIKSKKQQNNGDAIIAKYLADNHVANGFGLFYSNSGNNIDFVLNKSSYNSNNKVSIPIDNKTHLVGAVYDKSIISIYSEDKSDTNLYSSNIDYRRYALTIGADFQDRDYPSKNGNKVFDGDINEVLVYDYAVNNEERERIESYLAIKYGLTLNHDYKFSNGQVIYTRDSYNQDIAGLATDGGWNLEQKVSSSINKSTYEGSDVVIATVFDFTSSNSLDRRTSLANGQALVWGKNNGDKSAWFRDGDYMKTSERWKVQNTNNVSDIYIRINLKGYPAIATGHKYKLIIDDDEIVSDGYTSIYDLKYLTDDIYTVDSSISFPNGVSFFTIGSDLDFDFGDAPSSYKTLNLDNGPKHIYNSNTYLGETITIDNDGKPSIYANRDNDDGVKFNPNDTPVGSNIIYAGAENNIVVKASKDGYLSVWRDINIDGDFDDIDEQIYSDKRVFAGENTLRYLTSNMEKHGLSYMRYRYSTMPNAASSPVGMAEDGEVEDYRINVVAAHVRNECNNLINGGFENKLNDNFFNEKIPGWNISSGKFQVANDILGTKSYKGTQFLELNGSEASEIYQDVVTEPGSNMLWSFAHKGRLGDETVELFIGRPDSPQSIGVYTTSEVLWKEYNGEYLVPVGQNITRILIKSKSVQDSRLGNFIDDVYFGKWERIKTGMIERVH